jgi:phospholipid transport system substrate-binding protein
MMAATTIGKVVPWALLACLLAAAPAGAAVQDPRQLVEQTTQEITGSLRAEQEAIKARPARLYEIVDKIVLPHFDFERMSSWVLGKYWREANAEERKRFTLEFKDLLVRTYAKALNDNYDRKITQLPARESADGKEITIRTEVDQGSAFPIPIDYKMHLTDKGWKVFDVSVDNISLVTNYRTSFAKEIRADGLPKFIDKLAARNEEARAQ